MDTETLDRILLDRALGTLPADVAQLLDAYLAVQPEQARHAAAYADTVQTARLAFGGIDAVTLPPFPRERLARLEHTRRQLRWVRNLGAAAALLVIGIGVGGVLQRTLHAPTTPTEPTAPVAERRYATNVGHVSDADGIWSIARWRAAAAERAPAPERRPDYHRESIFSRPELRGAS